MGPRSGSRRWAKTRLESRQRRHVNSEYSGTKEEGVAGRDMGVKGDCWKCNMGTASPHDRISDVG